MSVSEDVENLRRLVKLEWKINAVTFVYHFTGNQINTYYKLFSGGYDLTKNRLKKIVTKESDKFGNEVHKTRYEAIEKVEESEEIEFDNNYHKDTTDRGSKKVLPKDLNKYKGSVSLEIELKQSKEKEMELEKEIEYIHHTVSNNRLRITIKARKKKLVVYVRILT